MNRFIDWICNALAWNLPDRVVYHAAIRLVSYGTVGKYGNTVVPELGAMDAIGRWSDDKKIHRR